MVFRMGVRVVMVLVMMLLVMMMVMIELVKVMIMVKMIDFKLLLVFRLQMDRWTLAIAELILQLKTLIRN